MSVPHEEFLKSLTAEKIQTYSDTDTILTLVGIIESQRAEIHSLKQIVQELRDELNHLKGEQGKPNIRGIKGKPIDISSEKERKPSSPSPHKGRGEKKSKIAIIRTIEVPIPKEELPDDAIFKGYDTVIVQNIRIVPDNIAYKIAIYYSPSTGKTYRARRPAGYEGEFGPELRSLILILKHVANVSESCIHSFLSNYGTLISKSSISRISRKDARLFEKDKSEIVKAGLVSTRYQHIDDTSSRVNGKQWYTHILCNPFFTAYFTKPHKDRLTILEMLCCGEKLRYRFNDIALELLKTFKVPEKVVQHIIATFDPETMDEERLDTLLESIPTKNKNPSQLLRRIKEAVAIGWYLTQESVPIIQVLMSDDAPQFRHITIEHALCWVHAGRNLKKLNPLIPIHIQELEGKLDEFWSLFRKIQEYQKNTELYDISIFEERFDQLVSEKTNYDALNDVLGKIKENKEKLLVPLYNPTIPLHNNPAELGARAQVRKRDVSLHTLTDDGTQAVDTFLTLTQTAKKLGVNIAEYIHATLTNSVLEPLSNIILKRAGI